MSGRLPRRAAQIGAGATALAILATGIAVAEGRWTAGPQGDGTGVTSVGQRVTPVGEVTQLGNLPLAVRLSPDGRTLLVSNNGQGEQSLQVIDARSGRTRQVLSYPRPSGGQRNFLFVGLAWAPDGKTAYAAGGGDEKVHVYRVSGGRLTEAEPIPVPPLVGHPNMFPAGLAVTGDGRRLVVADHLGDAASVVDLATRQVSSVAVGHAPWGVAVSPDGRTAWVSNQGGSTVSRLDLTSGAPVQQTTIPVGTHPNALQLDRAGRRLFVANGDSDDVSVVDTRSGTTATVSLAPYPGAPSGSAPSGLALGPEERRLYVTLAGNNDVAVVDLGREGDGERGESGGRADRNGRGPRVAGLVPTAWYPTGVAATQDTLYVASAKGLGAGPNTGPGHPDPTSPTPTAPDQYTGSMMRGLLSRVELPLSGDRLAGYTRQVKANNRAAEVGSPRSPIKHVIYVVKENRTYDQVFGSLGKGNGDPRLTLFGQESAPNARDLQRRFVTLDNFYAAAEVSADGWDWSTQANANLFNQSLWPANYSGRNAPYPSENSDPAHAANRDPAQAYLWDRLAAKGISFRNYGFYVKEQANHTFTAVHPTLDAHTDHNYRGFDMACPSNSDTFAPRKSTCGPARIDEWLKEFAAYERTRTLPTVELVRLPTDHTSGTKPGYPTPRAYVADDDLALGRLVDAVSHSPDWKSTAIFVTEDDAQNGPDHVDAHRTIAQVISPYTQTGRVDSTFYSTASMLRTMENLVGIAPMTQFDAYATPMVAAFSDRANAVPYTAVRPAMAGNQTNAANAPMAAASARQDLSAADRIDERVFNEAIWQSVRGAGSPMPAPRGGAAD